MLVALDISNTRVTLGVFDGEAGLRAVLALAADVRRTEDEYAILVGGFLQHQGVAARDVHAMVIASVVPPLTEHFEHLGATLFGVRPLTVGAGTRSGLRIATANPREVGPDRVVNAVAARHLYGAPTIVVDFDTATTFDVVAADGAYAGCAIAAGLSVSAEALVQRASLLHRVELQSPGPSAIGRDTASALQAGLFLGHVAMVDGLVARLRAELGGATVVATGEQAAAVAAETSAIDHVEPHLSLLGLRLLHELHHSPRREGRAP